MGLGGAVRNFYRRWIAGVVGIALVVAPFANAGASTGQNIGDAQVVVNDVRGVIGNRAPETLRAGIDVFQNEIIRTGERSASRVLFQDNTTLAVGAASEVTLDRFVFDPNPEKSQVALSIAKGVVRFATGSLPKPAYQITTPTATIGIRGTILTVAVAIDGTTSVSVEEGVALVSAAAQTVEVESGMTTTTSAGMPPTPPQPSPPSPPAVTEMDALLTQGVLAPGAAAGTAASLIGPWAIPVAVAAVVVGVVVGVTAGGGGNATSTTR
jgi:hypothetical protein